MKASTARYRAGAKRVRSGLRRLMKRDKNRCHICGLAVRAEEASKDHIVPRSQGGSSARSNLALAHQSCNNGRATERTTTRVTKRGWR